MLDEIDLQIIKELMENARKPFREIAEKLQLSDVAVIKRVKKLESRGIIKKYALIVDPSSLGYAKVSYTGINVKPEKLFDVAAVVREKPYVKFLALTTGDHSMIAVIWAKDSEDLYRIHEELKSIDGVMNIYPAIIASILKEEAHI